MNTYVSEFIDRVGNKGKVGDIVTDNNRMEYCRVEEIRLINYEDASMKLCVLTLDTGINVDSMYVTIVDLADARVLNEIIPV